MCVCVCVIGYSERMEYKLRENSQLFKFDNVRSEKVRVRIPGEPIYSKRNYQLEKKFRKGVLSLIERNGEFFDR